MSVVGRCLAMSALSHACWTCNVFEIMGLAFGMSQISHSIPEIQCTATCSDFLLGKLFSCRHIRFPDGVTIADLSFFSSPFVCLRGRMVKARDSGSNRVESWGSRSTNPSIPSSLKVKGQGVVRPTRAWRTFLSIGTHRLRASLYPLWTILIFMTLKCPRKDIRGQRS
jgi:hypothetical protein